MKTLNWAYSIISGKNRAMPGEIFVKRPILPITARFRKNS
jgi:hypothetical protein